MLRRLWPRCKEQMQTWPHPLAEDGRRGKVLWPEVCVRTTSRSARNPRSGTGPGPGLAACCAPKNFWTFIGYKQMQPFMFRTLSILRMPGYHCASCPLPSHPIHLRSGPDEHGCLKKSSLQSHRRTYIFFLRWMNYFHEPLDNFLLIQPL